MTPCGGGTRLRRAGGNTSCRRAAEGDLFCKRSERLGKLELLPAVVLENVRRNLAEVTLSYFLERY
jgi:hypothetical protein